MKEYDGVGEQVDADSPTHYIIYIRKQSKQQ